MVPTRSAYPLSLPTLLYFVTELGRCLPVWYWLSHCFVTTNDCLRWGQITRIWGKPQNHSYTGSYKLTVKSKLLVRRASAHNTKSWIFFSFDDTTISHLALSLSSSSAQPLWIPHLCLLTNATMLYATMLYLFSCWSFTLTSALVLSYQALRIYVPTHSSGTWTGQS